MFHRKIANIYSLDLSIGVCCGWGTGSVEVRVDGTSAMTAGAFGDSETFTFGSCASNPETDSPTGSPSKAPSGSPSSNPTAAPSTSPSKEVSYYFCSVSSFDHILCISRYQCIFKISYTQYSLSKYYSTTADQGPKSITFTKPK